MDKKKKGSGRKSKYDTHVKPRLETIRAWRRKGLTEKEICKNLGVGHSVFNTYKNKHSELVDSLKEGLLDAVAQVESALFKTAIGYDYEEDVVVGKGDNAYVERVQKHQPPIVIAQIFFLKNRAFKDWRDRIDQALQGPDGKPLQASSVVIMLPENNRNEEPSKEPVNPRLATIQNAIKESNANS
jgi:transcriptional regulator with XRE-family HTH domain